MLQDIRYANPDSLEDAVTLLEEYGEDATVISGGQSLMPMLRQRLGDFDCLVDINSVEEADYVRVEDGRVRVGCLARHATVATSEAVRERCQILAETVADIGDAQVRNRGTFCGAVAHADPAGDPPVVVAALDATITSVGPDGERTYEGTSFFHGFYETALGPGEIVSEVAVPVVEPPRGAAYEKYEPSAGAYPTATVAAVVELDGDRVAEATLVTGAIEPGPTPATEAAAHIEGTTLSESLLTEAAELAGEGADPMPDSDGSAEFKREMTKTLTKRALVTAVERAGGDLS